MRLFLMAVLVGVVGVVGLLGLPAAALADAGAITAVHIVSNINGGAATDTPKRALKSDSVTLHAVLEVRVASKVRYFSSASKFRLAGKKRSAKPMAEAPTHFVAWHTVEPTAESMSNTSSGKFRFERIEYGESLIFKAIGAASIEADVRPTLTTDRGDGVGTMRFKATVIGTAGVVSTPSVESRAGRGAGGLAKSVHRVTRRRDDSYLGFLTELYGQPYIWASAGRTDRSHQSERLEGSDCADFIVYGHRRMGGKVPYTWTGSLPDYTDLVARGEADESGVYRDKKGKPIAFGNVGDIILFPRHVGALTQDLGTAGVLDHNDIMMHSYFASPREQSLGDSDYASTWLEVRRWR